jgi:capsular polysaccharide biosynthesis protein
VELNGFFPIIRRWLAVILAATVVATIVGLVLGASAAETYEARAELLVGPLSTDSDTMRASGDLAQTYAQLATSNSVLATASRELDLPLADLRTGVRATANSTTRFLVIRARSHDADDAADIANAISLRLLELGKQDPTRPEGQLRVIDPAGAPGSPTSPRLELIVPLAALAGLLGSITLVLLFEFVGDNAESAEKIEELTGSPTLALGGKSLRRDGPNDPFRIIATQVDLAAPSVRCVLLTGITDDDGTDEVADRLAEVWSQRRPTVAILDARSGELQLVPARGGAARTPLRRAAGDRPSRPEAITFEEAEALRSEATASGGLLIVLGGPATASAATLVWARVADVTVLSIRRFRARRTAISEAVANLAAVSANVALNILHEQPRTGRRTGGPTSPRANGDGVAEGSSGTPSRPPVGGSDGADVDDELDDLVGATSTRRTNGSSSAAVGGDDRPARTRTGTQR